MIVQTTFGRNISVTISGGSHEPEMRVAMKGFPRDIQPVTIDTDALQAFLDRRAPGISPLATSRKESDQPVLVSAAPLTYSIRNQDRNDSDYEALKDTPRPGHADYTAYIKYRGAVNMAGGGPFSGRMTAPLCVAGGIALQWLARRGIFVSASLTEAGGATGKEMDIRIADAKANGDSVGGLVHCTVTGLMPGLGGPLSDGLESFLSPILFAIPGVKGVSFGDGFDVVKTTGSKHNDPFVLEDGKVITATNHAGGILGGISTGMPLELDVAFKPTPSISKLQQTVNLATMTPATLSVGGRHDPCIALRGVPVVEAAVALGLLDAAMGDEAWLTELEQQTLTGAVYRPPELRCGLLGERLDYSYSQAIHEALGLYDYALYPMEPEAVANFLATTPCTGLNITAPYKQTVIPYCDEITPLAEAIGSINTMYRRDGKWFGSNTDYEGFLTMLMQAQIPLRGQHILILGSGGASAMVQYACQTHRAASVTVAARRGSATRDHVLRDGVLSCTYENLPKRKTTLIINATPVGTVPDLEKSPVDLREFPNLKGVVDLIYNPLRTRLLLQAWELGIPHCNGLAMLVTQALSSASIFAGDAPFPVPGKTHPELCKLDSRDHPLNRDTLTDRAYTIQALVRILDMQARNLVLIGMPGSGKSSLGRQLARALGRPFVDADKYIKEKTGRKPEQIIREDGEEAFRDIEEKVIAELARRESIVLATGGGIVEREENLRLLKQTGFLLYVQRDVKSLSAKGRPLSEGDGVLEALYRRRQPLYTKWADLLVNNDRPFQKTVNAILRNLR